jgi:hypothetical protein
MPWAAAARGKITCFDAERRGRWALPLARKHVARCRRRRWGKKMK